MQYTHIRSETCSYRGKIGRRDFLITMGASAMALDAGLIRFASSLFASESKSSEKPLVHAIFLRPNVDRYWMSWPGAAYEIKERQADYTKVMMEAADQLGVQLQVRAEPLFNEDNVNDYLKQLKSAPPDGVIVVLMSLITTAGPMRDNIESLIKNRGDIPTIVFSPMGTSFLQEIQELPKIPKTLVASTQDNGWLAFGMRMLNIVWRMKNTRICVVCGEQTVDVVLDTVGTTLHYIPPSRFVEEFKKTQKSDEVRAIADYYIKNAKKIVEPTKQDVLEAAKTYVACRRIMDTEKCHGIAIDCLPIVKSRNAPSPCLAFTHLRDEGVVASCQADWPAAISSRLTHLLLDRPGFMQNISVNTINNTLMAAHCACATKLAGFDKPAGPFILRSHAESNLGVATQVIWPVGQKVTLMKFNCKKWSQRPPSAGANEPVASTIVLGSGRVLCNMDNPPAGGCRTMLELEVDGIDDVLDLKPLHHQLLILGDHTRQFRAYAQLAGINVVSI